MNINNVLHDDDREFSAGVRDAIELTLLRLVSRQGRLVLRHKSTSPIPEPIEQLQRQLDQFRSGHAHRSRLPESLWQSAVELARQHGLYAVARPLRLDYMQLKGRLGGVVTVPRKTSDLLPGDVHRSGAVPRNLLPCGQLGVDGQDDGTRQTIQQLCSEPVDQGGSGLSVDEAFSRVAGRRGMKKARRHHRCEPGRAGPGAGRSARSAVERGRSRQAQRHAACNGGAADAVAQYGEDQRGGWEAGRLRNNRMTMRHRRQVTAAMEQRRSMARAR